MPYARVSDVPRSPAKSIISLSSSKGCAVSNFKASCGLSTQPRLERMHDGAAIADFYPEMRYCDNRHTIQMLDAPPITIST